MSSNIVIRGADSGFFSCAFLILVEILDYFNKEKELPHSIEYQNCFPIYKRNTDENVYNLFFEMNNDINIEYGNENIFYGDEYFELQFSNYKLIQYEIYKPFIDKYLTFNDTVIYTANQLKNQYNIDYDNTCGIFYRGNDKIKETQRPSYEEVVAQALEVKNENPNIKFVVQTDEYEFLEYFLKAFPETTYFNEIPLLNNEMTTVANKYQNDPKKYDYILFYIASVYSFSKFKKIITTSGNGELFVMFYRNNAEGVIQYLKKNEYIHGVKNKNYDENQTIFWLK